MTIVGPRVVCDHSESWTGPRRIWIQADDGARLYETEFYGDDEELELALGRMLNTAAAAGHPVEELP